MLPNQDPFELVTTSQGALSIRDLKVGETMHNPLGPWQEIQQLYIKPAQIPERLQALSKTDEMIIYDVGLGAGSNAMGVMIKALKAIQDLSGNRRLKILSFEQDLALAQFALENQRHFPEFAWGWEALQELLEVGSWKHPEYSLSWELHHDNFVNRLDQNLPPADLIFYDPYSPKRNQEMWTLDTFQKLRKKCHLKGKRESFLLTYSRATSVCAALLLERFYVGKGSPLGFKEETTQAATHLKALAEPLEKRWLERWTRSHVPLPPDLNLNAFPQWTQKIQSHPQFH